MVVLLAFQAVVNFVRLPPGRCPGLLGVGLSDRSCRMCFVLFVTWGVAPGCWVLFFQTVLAGFVSFVTRGVAPGYWVLAFQAVLAGCVTFVSRGVTLGCWVLVFQTVFAG